jgi:hypothetical protein
LIPAFILSILFILSEGGILTEKSGLMWSGVIRDA